MILIFAKIANPSPTKLDHGSARTQDFANIVNYFSNICTRLTNDSDKEETIELFNNLQFVYSSNTSCPSDRRSLRRSLINFTNKLLHSPVQFVFRNMSMQTCYGVV